jgi:DNA polymerase III sliding clamp (beta) subunit (PCNA family)
MRLTLKETIMKLSFNDPVRFIAALKAVATHVSRDETRPQLNSVCVDLNGPSLDLAGTDGHRLALYRFVESAFRIEGDVRTQFLISLADVNAFVKAAGKKPAFAEVELTEGKSDGTLTAGNAAVKFRAVQATFPPLPQVFPDDTSNTLSYANALYIADAAKAFQSLGSERTGASIRIRPTKDRGPIVITSANVPELFVIVMPMREPEAAEGVVSARAIFEDFARLPGDMTPVEPKAEAKAGESVADALGWSKDAAAE